MSLEQPILPYAGTSGWSGSETSRQRALTQDRDGTTGKRQRETLRLLQQYGGAGLTWQQLSEMTGWHHGTASGALSVLHKAGKIARLKNVRRNRCAVYVALEALDGRENAQPKIKTCKHCGGQL